MATTPPTSTYSEEEVSQALASVYALLLRAARRKRLAETQPGAVEEHRAADASHRLDDDPHRTSDT